MRVSPRNPNAIGTLSWIARSRSVILAATVALTTALASTACEGHHPSVSPLLTPDSVLTTPTALPPSVTTTTSPTSTATRRPTPTPSRPPFPTPTAGGPIRQIVFSACACDRAPRQPCPADWCVPSLYAINSDGTGLRTLIDPSYSSSDPSFSLDGRFLAYVQHEPQELAADEPGHGMITFPNTYIMDLGTGQTATLGTESYYGCQWLPDSARLVCYADRDLYTVPTDGTPAMRLTAIGEGDAVRGFDVSPEGEHIVYALEQLRPSDAGTVSLYQVGVMGGDPTLLVTLSDITSFGFAQFSPDGQRLLLSTRFKSTTSTTCLIVLEMDTYEMTELPVDVHVVRTARWLPDNRRLFVVGYDPDQLVNVLYVVDNAGALSILELPELECAVFGELLPDQRYFVFAEDVCREDSRGGLFVADLEAGTWGQILFDYQVTYGDLVFRP